jgi:hypothetical protein
MYVHICICISLDIPDETLRTKISTKTLHISPQTSLERISSLSLRDIRSSLSELNSCFAILFPGVTIPDIEAFPRNQLETDVNDSTGMVSKDRISSSDRVMWEHDGEEIEAPLDYNLGMFIKCLY